MSFDAVLRSLRGVDARGVVGALERRNPLPPGRYWIDVFEQHSAAFAAWLGRQAGKVRVESTERFAANAGGPAREFVLFQVLEGVPWEGPGLPTIADAGVRSSADTVERPPPAQGPIDALTEDVRQAADATRTVVLVAAGAGGLYLLFKLLGGRR